MKTRRATGADPFLFTVAHMNISRRTFSTCAATLTTAALAAIPVSAHADPTWPWAPNPNYSVIDTSALPLSDSANWAAVTGNDFTSDALGGVVHCTLEGRSATADFDPRAKSTSQVYTANLQPSGDTEGWDGAISATSYRGINAASYALSAYRRYLDACQTAPTHKAPYRNSALGTSVLDPTEAHALIETADTWMEVFAVATNDALVEALFTHPKDGQDAPLEFPYNPAAVFNALKMADIGVLAQPTNPT